MKNNFSLVSGAAGFLGGHFCEAFLNNKFNLIMVDKKYDKLIKIKKILEKKYPERKILALKLDIANEKQIVNCFNNLKKKNFFVNVLVNNAAIDAKPNNAKAKGKYINLQQWEKEIKVGLTGTYLMIKTFGEEMSRKKTGSIVNIGSDLSVISPDQKIYKKSFKNYYKPASYSTIKHGLVGMTKYFSTLFASSNVRCNLLSPGPVFHKQPKDLKTSVELTKDEITLILAKFAQLDFKGVEIELTYNLIVKLQETYKKLLGK